MLLYLCMFVPLLQVGFSSIEEDADLSPLSLNYEVVESLDDNFESWGENSDDIIVFDTVSTTDLSKICKNSNAIIYIKQEDIVIDCKVFKGEQSKEQHEIAKRAADEEEGSGNGSEGTIDEAASIKEKDIQTETPNTIKEVPEPPSSTKEDKPEETLTTEDETKIQVNLTESETSTQNSLEASKIPEETQDDLSTADIPTTEQENTYKKEPKTDLKPSAIQNEKTKPLEQPSSNDKKEEKPSLEGEERESINKKGRTLVQKKEGPAESSSDGQVKESVETPKKAASKDTTILVFLFVAVVVVGAAAFAYNFVKKRRQQTADSERVERLPTAKRSLQNVNNVDSEPEQKPLIGEKKEVEMVDLKKIVPEFPNDGAVKT